MGEGQQKAVYVIQHELGLVKIGIATEPKARLNELQVACPFQLRLRETKRPRDARRVEKFLHHRFRKYHFRGEWFDIPRNQRGFKIPNKILGEGRADVEVTVAQEYETEDRWVETLDRVARSFRRTRVLSAPFERLQDYWRELGESYEPQKDVQRDRGPVEPAELSEAIAETPEHMHICGQCGHEFDRDEDGCPVCASEQATDAYEQ